MTAKSAESVDEPASGVDVLVPPKDVDLHHPAQRLTVEHALKAIPGVIAARIVPGFERPVDELHVLTTMEKGPKQTVRDVVSMMMARYSVSLDHRVISVVRLNEDDAGIGERRVRIGTVSTEQEALRCAVKVAIVDGDDIFQGEDDGPASMQGRRRAAARATLKAVLPLLGDDRVAEIEGIDVLEVRGHMVAMSFVHVNSSSGDTTVCGSAMVRGDELDSIARSVLDAVNRMIHTAR